MIPTLTAEETCCCRMNCWAATWPPETARARELLERVGLAAIGWITILFSFLAENSSVSPWPVRRSGEAADSGWPDEPTGNLDSVNGQHVLQLLDRL